LAGIIFHAVQLTERKREHPTCPLQDWTIPIEFECITTTGFFTFVD